MLAQERSVGRRAVKLVVLAGLIGLLGACEGITPMKTLSNTGPQEMDPNQPGVLSGDQGSITLFERK